MKPIVFEELKVGDELVTRDGRKARVLAIDFKCKDHPLLVAIENKYRRHLEYCEKYYTTGFKYLKGINDDDLFLPPKDVERFYNVYAREEDPGFYIGDTCYISKRDAKIDAEESRDTFIRTIRVVVKV